MPQGRFRADLVDVGWAPEHTYGTNPPAGTGNSQVTGELGADDAGGSSLALYRQWGIVNGGINLPNPTFAWTPFYGIGVDDRNMLFPIQGQETLEGGIPSAMLCHDSSRMAFEQMYGLIFNAWNIALTTTTVVSENALSWAECTATVDHESITLASGVNVVQGPLPGVAGVEVGGVDGTNQSLIDFTASNISAVKVAANTPPTHIILVSNSGGADANPWACTWAYIGPGGGDNKAMVFQDRGLAIDGWNGKRPSGGGDTYYSIHSIERFDGLSAKEDGILRGAHATAHKAVFVRPTLVQSSFVLGAKFRADDGSNFITNYTGCKVSRFTISMDEGSPVTFNYDFIAQDMRHNIGEDDGTGAVGDIARYLAKGVTNTNTIDIQPMRVSRVTEQPYFFTGAEIKLHGTTFARLRSLSISVDNALDPRYYVTQSAAAAATHNDRQILYEILEGRRTITVSGSVDMDNTGATSTGGTGSRPTDAKLLQYVLNQGFNDTDQRDMQTLEGITLEVELRKIKTASGGSTTGFDKVVITIPDPGKTTQAGAEGSTAGVGLYLNSAGHAIPAPPSVHIPVDFDGQASSMAIKFLDNASS